uniref:RRM domain-containing protein n=1 Tax=Macrostomum lignano TaxID=282301 RepID=A0A1I8F4X8_9PLAT
SSKDSSKASAKNKRSNKSKSKKQVEVLVGFFRSLASSFPVRRPRILSSSSSSSSSSFPPVSRRFAFVYGGLAIRVTRLTRNVARAHLEEIFGMYGALRRIDIPPTGSTGADSRASPSLSLNRRRSGRRLSAHGRRADRWSGDSGTTTPEAAGGLRRLVELGDEGGRVREI